MKAPRASRRQRGVALIIALVIVALATILAWKIGFDGFLERRRTEGVLAIEQAMQFGLGAEALAADVLDRQLQQGPQVNLAQPWAQATQPLPITPEENPDGPPIGTLQGYIADQQGLFNLNNLGHLLPNGTQDPQPLLQFQRLLISVHLEPKWAQMARDWIAAVNVAGGAAGPDGAGDDVYTRQTPPYWTGNWPMTSPSELMVLPGFGRDRYLQIAPYVTALPTATAKINICTAPALVLESLAPGLAGEYSGNPQTLTVGRKSGCFPDMNTFDATVGPMELPLVAPLITDSSQYFRLTTRVTLGTTEFTLYSLLLRGTGGKITPLLRSFGTL